MHMKSIWDPDCMQSCSRPFFAVRFRSDGLNLKQIVFVLLNLKMRFKSGLSDGQKWTDCKTAYNPDPSISRVQLFIFHVIKRKGGNYLSTSGIARGSYNSSLCSKVGTDIADTSWAPSTYEHK